MLLSALGFYENNGRGFESSPKVIVYEKDDGFADFNGADLNGNGKGEIFSWDNSQWNDSTLQLFEQPLEWTGLTRMALSLELTYWILINYPLKCPKMFHYDMQKILGNSR